MPLAKNSYQTLAFWTLFLFHLLLCFLLYSRQQIISRDSLIFIDMAQSASQGDWNSFFATGHHPLYPLLIAGFHSVFQEMTEKSLMLSGQILTFSAYVLAGLAVYQLAKTLFFPLVALIAYFLAILQPYFCREAGDVLTDLPYLAFFLWGFYALYIGFWRQRLFAFLLAGICASSAYLIRPEGLILPTFFLFWSAILFSGLLQKHFPKSVGILLFSILLTLFLIIFTREIGVIWEPLLFLIPFWMVVFALECGWVGYLLLQPSFLWCSQWTPRKFFWAVFLFMIAFLPASCAYMSKIGGISLKQRSIGERVVQFLKKADPGSTVQHKPDPETHKQAPEIQNVPIPDFRFISTEHKKDSLFFTFIETAHPYLSLLFLGVIVLRIKEILYCWRRKKPVPYAGEILLYLAFLMNWVVLWSVNFSAGYIARRHNFSIIALSLPYSAYAIYRITQILYQKIPYYFSKGTLLQWTLQSPRRIRCYKKMVAWCHKTSFGFWLVSVLLLSALILMLKGLKPIEPAHFYLRQLGAFMLETYGPEKIYMGNLPRIAFYAEGKNVPFTKPVGNNGLTDLSRQRVDFILIKEDFLSTGNYEVVVSGQYRLIQFWLQKRWIEAVLLPETVVDPKNKVLLYRVLQENLPK